MKRDKARIRPLPLPLQYSAEDVRSDGYATGKVYTDGHKSRSEQTIDGITKITIWRPDLGKFYGIDWDQQTYRTHSITPEIEATMAVDLEDDVEWEHVATEPFGSRTVDVYDVFAIGTTHRRARIWVDSETHIRWKEVTYNKLGKEVLTSETKNVEIGPPPASVFELPPGLQEFKFTRRSIK